MDVVICTYNNAMLLDRTLASIAQQQVSACHTWSVLVVDNNCTDSTADLVNQYIQMQTIPGLRRVVESKQGLTQARLCGLRHTTSDWIAFIDDDCLLAETWVEQAIQFAAAHSQCGAFGGKVLLEWEQPPSPLLLKHQRAFAASDRGESVQKLSRQQFHLPGAGLVVQRAALLDSGWLDQPFLNGREGTKLTAGEDSEIVLRILNAGYEVWYTPNCRLHHFIPTKRISESYLAKMTYGFGMAAPYIASLRWNQSYWIWLIICVLRTLKYSLETVLCAISSVANAEMQTETQVRWNWTKGQIDGLLALLTMPRETRSVWLNVFK